jgi:hypothetical protein
MFAPGNKASWQPVSFSAAYKAQILLDLNGPAEVVP